MNPAAITMWDCLRELQLRFHRYMRDRAEEKQNHQRWMHHRARLVLLERIRKPHVAAAFDQVIGAAS